MRRKPNTGTVVRSPSAYYPRMPSGKYLRPCDTLEEAESLLDAALVRGADEVDGVSIVYFAQEDGPSGRIKIGRTRRLKQRVRELQRDVGASVRVIATMKGGPRLERAILEHVAQFKTTGEWFWPTPEIWSLLNEIEAAYGSHGHQT